MAAMTRLGYQMPNFTYPGTAPADLFDAIAAQARAAEASGFDTVLVMDHFFQLPSLGPITHEMIECYVLLAGLARETSKVRLSALVTGNTYRNPAVLAKTVTALDLVSGGRAQLGIGSGWFEAEHTAFGIEFGTFTDRFEKLEEALQIIGPMLRGEDATLDGTKRQDVSGLHQLERFGRRIGQDPTGARAIGCRDAGGDAVAGVHRDRVRGPHEFAVVRGHQRDPEPVEGRSGHGRAHVATGVADEEPHQLRGRLAGGEDDVAFVLAVLVIDDDDRLPGLEVGQRTFDGVQLHGH